VTATSQDSRVEKDSVLHVITRIDNGGSEKRLIDALCVQSVTHEVIAGTVNQGKNSESIANRATIDTISDITRNPHPIKDFSALLKIRSKIIQSSPTIIHSHQSKAGILCRLVVATLPARKRPKLVHSLSMASFGKGYSKVKSSIFKTLEKLTHRWVDEFLVVGSDLSDTFKDIGVPDSKLIQIRSSLKLERFKQQARQRFFGKDNCLNVLYVGSLEKRKNVDMLLAAVDNIKDETSLHLKIAGTGDQVELLQDYISKNDTPAELLGFRTDIEMLMKEADLFVLPSSAEGLPQVLVQACTNNLPFISFDVHGSFELSQKGAESQILQDRTQSSLENAILDYAMKETELSTESIHNDCSVQEPEVEKNRGMKSGTLDIGQWEINYIAKQYANSYTIN